MQFSRAHLGSGGIRLGGGGGGGGLGGRCARGVSLPQRGEVALQPGHLLRQLRAAGFRLVLPAPGECCLLGRCEL